AGPRGRSACAICLGRFAHKIAECNLPKLWDGSPTHSRRTQEGRLVNPQGLTLCTNWQRPGGCSSGSHDFLHECSGCGLKDHGAQSCPRGEK
ncbi:hypothetical protein K503DRAFT_653968, partial [Rhizopogon vinicolor AM-OR11-026]